MLSVPGGDRTHQFWSTCDPHASFGPYVTIMLTNPGPHVIIVSQAKLEAYGEAELTEEQQLDVDMRLARLERLMVSGR